MFHYVTGDEKVTDIGLVVAEAEHRNAFKANDTTVELIQSERWLCRSTGTYYTGK
jgi:hypothetical protein